jgi:hypothetical protein
VEFKFITGRAGVPLLVALSVAFTGAASAASVSDPANDFVPSFTGPNNGDLDVLSANVVFNGSDFTFTSTLNGAIGTTPGASYVFGLDRGAGTAGFKAIAPGVTFDSVFIIDPSGTSVVRDLTDGASFNITDVSASGSMITGVVPLSDLPSKGFTPSNYLYNLWPKAATGAQPISDFAPDNSDARVTSSATPEPGTMSLVGISVLGAFALLRRRKTAQ